MANQLAVALRPKRLSDLLGQERIVRKIRNMSKKRRMKAYLFHGPKGTGKTTTARILAIALQCRHQEQFGDPCDKCRRLYKKKKLPIIEINCASIIENSAKQKMSAAQAIRDRLSDTSYELLHGRYRVYILDEAHRLSGEAQDACLPYFEDSSEENIFIINSTRPDKIVNTLRSRCQVFHFKPLDPDNIKKLVRRGLKYVGSDLSSTRLTDELVDNGVNSPRLILNAVESYVAGDSPEEAAQVEGETEVDSKALVRHVIKGDWPGIAKMIREASAEEARRLRGAVIGYLKVILFDSAEIDDRTKALCKAIKILSGPSWVEDNNQVALLAAELALLCKIFRNYGF